MVDFVNKKFSIFPIISLLISILAFALYAILLGGTNVYIPWMALSILSILFPVLSKYMRNKKAKSGKGLEITALVIGSFDFYFFFFATTKINLLFVFIAITVICILYAKLFNKVTPIPQPTENGDNPEQGKPVKRQRIRPATKISLIITIILLVLSLIAGLLMWHAPYNYVIEYVCMTALSISLIVYPICLIIILCDSVILPKIYSSVRYREKCYKKVIKMQMYLEKGVITQEEFEKNKLDILKNIKL